MKRCRRVNKILYAKKALSTHLLFTVLQRQRHHVFAQCHYMQTMFVDGLTDSSVFLQQRLGGVLIVSEVFAGDQAVGVLQPGHQVVSLRGELKKV